MNTVEQYKRAISQCQNIFEAKLNDYGAAWRIMRTITVCDQLLIKVRRVRGIEEGNICLIKDENIQSDITAIVNYAIIAIIQTKRPPVQDIDITPQEAIADYRRISEQACELMQRKNHDYGEAWRDMSKKSLTDIILTKLLRNKNIIEHDNKTTVSEGIEGNFFDIINYAIFYLIKD